MTIDWIFTLLQESWSNLLSAFLSFLLPAFFFICLGYIVKRDEFVNALKTALPEFKLNVKLQLVNILFSAPLVAIYVTAIHGFMIDYELHLFNPGAWDALPMAFTFFMAVFVGDFFHYWRHRLDHTRLLWPAHAVHHSDTYVSWFTSARWHPINLLTMRGVGGVAMLLMGFPPEAIVFNSLVRAYYGYFIHADVPWTYGKWGKYLVSPAMHRWHHSAEAKAFDKNFGEFFCIFDRAFGTFYLPGPCEGPLGVHHEMESTLRGQLGYAFMPKAYKPFVNKLKRTWRAVQARVQAS